MNSLRNDKKRQGENRLALKNSRILVIIKQNDYVFDFSGDQTKHNQGQIGGLKGLQLSFPYLFSFRLDKYNTKQKEHKCGAPQTYPERKRQVFKKITCKSNSKNCFTEIAKIFSDKFLSFFVNSFNQDKPLSLVRYGERQLGSLRQMERKLLI